MRTILSFVLGGVLVVLGGCEPSVSDEELGTVVREVPKIEESGEPYELPHVPAPPKPKEQAKETPPEK